MSEILFHEQLGRGGYGEVYRATVFREGSESVVAVKVLNASVRDGSDAQRRLRDEARVLGAIRHPNILRVHDLVEIQEHVAMIAEFVPGEDLDRCVLDGLGSRALLEVIAQVASALAAAWSAPNKLTGKPLQLVHRDIKPENLRVRPDGRVKILDFGVARAMELQREAQTATNTVMGSFRYMAPERFDSELVPHPSVDVFALGCILYEGLAYRRLFEHLSMREMMVLSIPGHDRYQSYIAERLEELPDTTEARLINLIHRLVEREPELRPLPEDLAATCLAIASGLPAPDLETWATQRDWAPGRAKRGDWTGRKLELPTDTEFTSYATDDDYTPTPSRPLRPKSDYDLPDEDLDTIDELIPPDLDTHPQVHEERELHSVTIERPKAVLAADEDTVSQAAIASLLHATSTPGRPADREIWDEYEAPTQRVPEPPPAPPPTPAAPEPEAIPEPERTPLPTEAIDVAALREGIGVVPSSTEPPTADRRPQATPSDEQGAIVANLVALALLGVLGLGALVLVLVIALR